MRLESKTIINAAWEHLAKKNQKPGGKQKQPPMDGWSFVSMNRDNELRASECGEEHVTLSNLFRRRVA